MKEQLKTTYWQSIKRGIGKKIGLFWNLQDYALPLATTT
jgi:hypothetical protein